MVPTSLARLEDLSMNLWWSWDAAAIELFQSIDAFRFERCRHNPVALLRDTEDARWAELEADPGFHARVAAVVDRFEQYLRSPGWAEREAPALTGRRIGYLSMEFGLHESLRLYSGGLGVLAGDHLRSASDLGVPLVAVGLLYHEGYFRQLLEDGVQIEAYPRNRWERLPLRPCLDAAGGRRVILVPIGDRKVAAQIWRLDVGRIHLYLLDTDFEQNTAEDREITDHLYGGDDRLRIRQELVLGLGAPRALEALQVPVDSWHLNEGHCAFVILELVSREMATGLPFDDALARVRTRCVFTTHTPVPAGHDRFHWDLVSEHLGPWRTELGLPEGTFMDLGRVKPGDTAESLCMTVVALRGTAAANAVSALHGEVSRAMWTGLWPEAPVEQVPIGHITNGVHPTFFMATPMQRLLDEHAPAWRERPWDPAAWSAVEQIPDLEIHEVRRMLRRRLVERLDRLTGRELDPDAVTFGFARRFAPYKRGDLLFWHPERLHAALTGRRGGQIVFAGKAHPRDQAGKDVLATVVKWAGSRDFRERMLFVEDYDLELGRLLTSGCDVWVNTPRRPLEASGTSGQKVVLNGGLNLSILDGWWPEGYDGENGWAIGTGAGEPTENAQDVRDAEALIGLIERDVMPTWRALGDDRLPTAWLRRIKHSIATCAPKFNSHRMVRDYALRLYAPLGSPI
jgi:starch phosphorylase